MDKHKGLGDTVAAITGATGIKAVVKALFGPDCGCSERQEKLNEWVPYGKKDTIISDDSSN